MAFIISVIVFWGILNDSGQLIGFVDTGMYFDFKKILKKEVSLTLNLAEKTTSFLLSDLIFVIGFLK